MKMKSKLFNNVIGYIVPIFVVLLAYLAFKPVGQGESEENVVPPTVTLQLLVEPVVAHDDVLLLEADGVVVPYREIQLATQVAGRIAHKAAICRAGNYVEQGQELFRIDDRDYKLEVSRLSKQLEQSMLQLEEVDLQIHNVGELIEIAQMEVQLQINEYNRLKKLEDGQVILASDVERAQRAVLMSRTTETQLSGQFATLNQSKYRLQAGTELAQIQLEKADLDNERTVVAAPVSGVIIRELVEEDSFAQKGATLVTIEDTSHVEVRCNLRMDDLYWIWNQRPSKPQGQVVERTANDEYKLPETPVDVIYELVGRGDATYHWEGRLERYDGLGLDQETRTVPVRVVVDKPHRSDAARDSGPSTLVRGMYVTVLIKSRPLSPLVRIPERSVQPGNRVWFVTPGANTSSGELGSIDHAELVRTVGEGVGTEWIIDNSSGVFHHGQLVVIRPFVGADTGDTVQYSLSPSIAMDDSQGEANE